MQPNYWTNRASTTPSASVLENQMEQLSVKDNSNNINTSNQEKHKNSKHTSPLPVCETRSPAPIADIISGESSSVATRASDSHGDNSNPQGGMKYSGGGNEISSVVAVGHPEDGKNMDNRKSNTEKHFMKVPPTKKDARKLFVGGIPSNGTNPFVSWNLTALNDFIVTNVFNLFFQVSDGEFRAFFEQFGEVIDSVVMYDRDTQRSRGFGFVTFESLVSQT